MRLSTKTYKRAHVRTAQPVSVLWPSDLAMSVMMRDRNVAQAFLGKDAK